MTPGIPLAAFALLLLFTALIAHMRREAGRAALETVRLTEEEDGLRIAQLTDIHIRLNRVPVTDIVRLLREASPHIVTLTGDYIENEADAEPFLRWMENLTGALGETPFYLCFGNHDAYAFKKNPHLKRDIIKQLKLLNVYILENKTLQFEQNGKLYAITGFTDYYSAPYANIRKALKGSPKNARYHIGISHNPDIAQEFSGPRPDLLLFGHFHGGQIWMPFHLEYICLRRDQLCKSGFRRGLYNYGGRKIYISRGVGCVLFPLRLGSRPEITLLIVP